MTFSEMDACVAAGLDLSEWLYGTRYPNDLKALVLAWYDAKNWMRLHQADAEYRANKKK